MRKEEAIIFDSCANFVLMKVPYPKDVVLQLRKKNIYVRDSSWIDQLDGAIRITIGYQKQMQRVVRAFRSIDKNHWIFRKYPS